jgi:hypothetical protein
MVATLTQSYSFPDDMGGTVRIGISTEGNEDNEDWKSEVRD